MDTQLLLRIGVPILAGLILAAWKAKEWLEMLRMGRIRVVLLMPDDDVKTYYTEVLAGVDERHKNVKIDGKTYIISPETPVYRFGRFRYPTVYGVYNNPDLGAFRREKVSKSGLTAQEITFLSENHVAKDTLLAFAGQALSAMAMFLITLLAIGLVGVMSFWTGNQTKSELSKRLDVIETLLPTPTPVPAQTDGNYLTGQVK